MANNQNDRTPQNTGGQQDKNQQAQQGMGKDSGTPNKEAQQKSDSDRDVQAGKSATDKARSDENQKR